MAKKKQMSCDFTIRYVPLPREKIMAWHAGVRWLVKICINSIENGLLDEVENEQLRPDRTVRTNPS